MKMREILYRGKERASGKWVYGGFAEYGNVQSVIVAYGKYGDNMAFEVDRETIGEYTGLRDNCEKRIFEGDIVELSHDWGDGTIDTWRAVVEFGNPNGTYSWGWQLRHISGPAGFNPDILLWVDAEDCGASCLIVGNIHDGMKKKEENA